MGRYEPWLLAACSTAVIVAVRRRTNKLILSGIRTVPKLVSALYMAGFAGLSISFFWATFRIGWWAFLPVLGLHALGHFVIPAVVPGTMRDPVTAHSFALMQAAEELGAFPPAGPEQAQKLMQRADEIMRSQGWKPRNPLN